MKYTFSLLFLIIFNVVNWAQPITFPEKWLFKTGDDSSYKEFDFNDTDWQKIKILSPWELEGYTDYDGFAWYRLHFEADKKYLDKELYLLLGKIDDIDETYLNGILVGKSGTLPPNTSSDWNTQRIYKIPGGILKEKNVLTVRVYDFFMEGGIYQGAVGIFDKEGYEKELTLGPAPKKSFFQLVTSNGLIAAVYNEKQNKIEKILPHIFQSYDENKRVKPFVKDLKLNTNEKPSSVSYIQNTHIIAIKYEDFSIKFFAPFTTREKILYIVIEGKKEKIKNLDFNFETDYCEVLKESVTLHKSGVFQKYILFSFNDSFHNNSFGIKTAVENLKVNDLLFNELNYMRKIITRSYIPDNLTEDEKNLYEQSISILKMGQVSQKEIFEKSRGQILASLPPGSWNIGWLRDAIYSILALNRLTLFDEAKQALNFFLKADAGYYKNYIYTDGIDYGVKTDYKLSVCRYFGIGKEESDFSDKGPNIELDGFGLFLIAFSDYINRSKDMQFLKDNFETISKLIADPIITFIDTNSLIRTESGPWESHLPGQQFSFTSIVCSAGLKDFAELCRQNNFGGYDKYFNASEELKEGIKTNLVYEGKLIKGFESAASPDSLDFYDGGTIEAFNFDVVTDAKFFKSYFGEYEKGLRISERRGFSRLNNPDWYTIGEWPFLNLRFASALLKYNFNAEAEKLIDWTTQYSKQNFNFVAELYDYTNENYEGAIPMVGYGAGAYIITLNDLYLKSSK